MSALSSDEIDEQVSASPPLYSGSETEGGSVMSSDDIDRNTKFVPTPILGASGYEGGVTWSDVGQAALAGSHALEATVASDFASHAYTPDAVQRWQAIAEQQRQAKTQDIQSMTPAGQQAREGSFFVHPLVVGAEQAPAIAATAAPAVVGTLVGGPVGTLIGVGGTIATMGEQQRGSAVDEFTQNIMDTPDAQLQQNPTYKSLRDSGGPNGEPMPEADAKRSFAHSQSGALALQSEALGAGIGAVSPYAEFMGLGANKILGDALVNRVLAGGLEGGVTMGGLSGAQTALTGGAEQQAGTRGPVTSDEILSSAWEGAKFGLGAGALGGMRGKSRPEVPQGGENTSVGSSRDSGKAAMTQPATAASDTGAATGPPPPTPEVKGAGLAEAAAVAAAQARPAPAPDVTQRVSEGAPQTTPEAAPAENTNAILPETPATRQQQFAALTDPSNSREALVYDKGEAPLPLPAEGGFGQTKLPEPDGRIVQYDKNGASNLTDAKVRDYAKTNRLNDLLQMGPITKDEAGARIVAGEPSVDVTERTPPASSEERGTEVKTAAGTAETAPAQVAAMEATKTPGNTVQVEHPANVINDRLRGVAQEAQAGEQERTTVGDRLKAVQADIAARNAAVVEAGRINPSSGDASNTRISEGDVSSAEGGNARAGGTAAGGAANFRPPVQEQLKARAAGGQRLQTMPRTIREGLAGYADPKTQQLARVLADKVGDVPVTHLPHGDFVAATGRSARGAYDTASNRILLNADHMTRDTLLHEAMHAGIARGMQDPELSALATRLYGEVRQTTGHDLGDGDEAVTRLNTDPTLRAELKHGKISPALAKDIGLPKWRAKNLWEGALNLFRRALGMQPRDISAIDAAMHLGGRLLEHSEVTPRVTPRSETPAGMRFQDLTAGNARGAPSEELARDPKSEPRTSDLQDGVAPARVAGRLDAMTSSLKQAVRDAPLYKTGGFRSITAATRHLIDTPRDWVQRAIEKKWGLAGAARRWADEMGAQSATRERIVKLSTPLMDRLMAFSRTNQADFKKLGKLFIDSTIHGADARDDLGTGKNAHINRNPTDKNGRASPENAPKEHWNAINGSPEDRALYKSLPAFGRDLYDDTMDELAQMHSREVAAGRQALVDGVRRELTQGSKSGAIRQERKDAVLKVLDGKELEGEEKVLHGDDDAIQALRDYDVLAAKSNRGVYFPLDHGDGSHVVTGEHDYKLPTDSEGNTIGTRFKDDPSSPDYHRILFDNAKDALNFKPISPAGVELPVDHYTVEGEHHAVVNPREVQYVNGNTEGEKVRAHMLAPKENGGLAMNPEKVSAVQPRKNQEPWREGPSANMVREQIKRLDKMTDLTDAERERMADAIKHVAASSMPGTRLRSTMLERDRTGGAGQDILRDLDKYRRRSAGQQAAGLHRSTIDQAMQEMHEYIDKIPPMPMRVRSGRW